MMDDTQESLLKLMLTADLNQYERAMAQYLAERCEDAVFWPASSMTNRAKKAVKSSSKVNTAAHAMVKYQFDDELGRRIKVELSFYCLSGWFAFNVIKAGLVGAGGMFSQSSNEFYKTVKLPLSVDVGSLEWEEVVEQYGALMDKAQAEIPNMIDERQAQLEQWQANTQVQREKRTLKKNLMKTGVFHLHKVRSTPETELLFKVVSRLGSESSVSKAFGELLPLITGELNDDNQS